MYKHLAIVGATGAVGKIVLQQLEAQEIPFESLTFLASKRSAGQKIEFKGKEHTVQELVPEVFDNLDLAIASTPDEVAAEFVPWARERNCLVVDESGYWRMDPAVPLVVPEVNPEAILEHQGVIASPNCSTTQMVVAMKPLHEAAEIKRVIVATYQSTSGAGVAGQDELQEGSQAALEGKDHPPSAFAHPIAFNLIPQIGSEKYQGFTSEEMKMVYETHKIFGDDTIRISPTCVRAPVTNCHSESIVVETKKKLSADEARKLFEQAEGITVCDNLSEGEYPMPLDCDGKEGVFVGRIREDLAFENGIAFWCVSDNLRKGAASNAVQIAKQLISQQVKLS
ncbi:MAG: aspartate-semialdehyde dehydrogenase [Pirellulaceae bacterium]|nr:aspartate-semialdehyde dehydrogenase [Pirellulaceae bacterium]